MGAKLRFPGLLCLPLLCLAACRLPPGEEGEAGPALLEILGLELDNYELQARKLRRRCALLKREIHAIHLRTTAFEQQKLELLARQEGPRKALAKVLLDLRFLEASLAKSQARGKVVAEQLRKIDADQARLKALEKRGAELPGLIKSLLRTQAELEKQVALLKKRKTTEEAELARLKGSGKPPKTQPTSPKTPRTEPGAKKPGAKKPGAKKPGAKK